MDETLANKKQFRMELFLALIITGLACAAGLFNILTVSNDLYPGATDFIGHMAKIQYITENLKEGKITSWFPYWYNGMAATQYYPPLSYYLTVPVYALTNNVMLTFKIVNFLILYTGGMGVWYFCRTNIGRWCGLFGIAVFCFQPFILRTLLVEGQIAQGPLIALLPWYMTALLSFYRKPEPKTFLLSTLFCSLMIISHSSSTFMYCACIMLAFTFFVPLRKISMATYAYLCLTVIFAGILTAFWSLAGVTHLENPTIPYLLNEVVEWNSAYPEHFLKASTTGFYFALPVSICSILTIVYFSYLTSVKRIAKEKWASVFFCILLTVLTIILSFGTHLPFYDYIPMASGLMPIRILNMASVSSAILSGFLIHAIMTDPKKKAISVIAASTVSIALVVSVLYFINPLQEGYPVRSIQDFDKMISSVDYSGDRYEKGRYSFLGAYDSSQTFFPLQYGFNLCEGFNVEGTIHHLANRYHIIANESGNIDYIAKNLAYWNLRYILLDKDYADVAAGLIHGSDFKVKAMFGEDKFYASDEPSSYFLTDKRNALIFGQGSPAVAIEFPYLIQGRSDNISDYSIDELAQYKLVYLCEPEVNTVQEKENAEAMIRELLDRGVAVIVEPTITKGPALFDVVVSDMALEESPVIRRQPDSKIASTIDNVVIEDRMKFGRALMGLDTVYYELVQNNGSLRNEILGTKDLSNGEVLFIGKHLSQYLKAVYLRNFGKPGGGGYPKCSGEIKDLFEDIFSTYGVNKDFWPDPFPVKKTDWNYKGVDFDYSSPRLQEITVSVTYAPRWKALLDGKPIPVGQKENLITLKLPAGDHNVKLVYGLTKYGIAGYIISLAGLVLFILFIRFYDIIFYKFKQISLKTGKYLQISQEE